MENTKKYTQNFWTIFFSLAAVITAIFSGFAVSDRGGMISYYCTNANLFFGFSLQGYALCPVYVTFGYIVFSLLLLMSICFSVTLVFDGLGLVIKHFKKPEFPKISVLKYSYPRDNHPRQVGITICNKDTVRDFTDISIKLTGVTQYERQLNAKEHKSTRIVDTSANEFELGENRIIKACNDKKSFFMVEIQQKDLVILTKEKNHFGHYYSYPMIEQPGYKMYDVVIEIEFEIHGNLGSDKVGEVYKTQIFSTRFIPIEKPNGAYDSDYDTVTMKIGDIYHIE